jgi:peptide/nickel transport system substrate-binding protein
MEMEKKNLAIIILAIMVAASGIGNVILMITGGLITGPPGKITAIWGYRVNPVTIDPVDTWDVPSYIVEYQVTESLVQYDLSAHPNYTLKPVLCEYWIWESLTRISFKLRDYVYFHDGTRMTAEDVKWNFERLMWFCNASGTLPDNSTSWEAFPSSLYYFSNGTFIFDSFEADDSKDPLNFTIILTAPFAPLLDLLTFSATYILSPESTPRWRYLDLATERIIGTGPYRYMHFKRDKEVRFQRNDMYWGFPGYFQEAVMRIIVDDTARMTAALAGQFDFFNAPLSYIDTIKAEPSLHVEEVGESLWYSFFEIYCGPDVYENGTLKIPGDWQGQKNNATLRRALALAINYTYLYEEIFSGYTVQGIPAVPRAMPGHNRSVVQASDYNFETGVEMARNYMKQYNPACLTWNSTFPGTDEALWLGANLLGRNLELNRMFGSTTNLRINQLLASNWDLIGIKISETIRDWDDYIDTGEHTPWKMDVASSWWCPDYLNPFNMIDPLFNLDSAACLSRINDTTLSSLIRQAAIEINRPKQLELYGNIQSLIFDVNRPLNPSSHAHISGSVDLVHYTHKVTLKGVEYNLLEFNSIKTWYYESD